MGEDTPTFTIEEVLLQFQLVHLRKLCVEDDRMYLILDTVVYKIDLKNPSDVRQYKLPDGRVTNSWLHPNGLHLIVQINNSSYYYLHDTYKSFKALPKFKNINIHHIAFTHGELDSGNFLVATHDGAIYVALIKPHDVESKKDDKYLKHIYKVGKSIEGLDFASNGLQVNVFAGGNHYTWDVFDTSYSQIVHSFKSTAPSIQNCGSDGVFASNGDTFVYLSKPLTTNDTELNLLQTKSLTIPLEYGPVRDLVMSPHHVICRTEHHLVIFNKLSPQDPQVVQLEADITGITADHTAGTFWLYGLASIYELVVQNESISVWYNYYRMGKYEEAIKVLDETASTGNSRGIAAKRDLVLVKQGYHYLREGGFDVDYTTESRAHFLHMLELQVKGVKILAKLTEPFEKVCLMLLNLQLLQDNAGAEDVSVKSSMLSLTSQKLLLEYLLSKFEIARTVNKNKIRTTVLSSWLVELFLRTLQSLESETNKPGTRSSIVDTSSDDAEIKASMLEDLNKQFQAFISSNYMHLDRKTVYQIMLDLHYPSKLLYYAELVEDFEYMLDYYISIHNWKDALKTLIKLYLSQNSDKLQVIYRTATELLVNSPRQTVETWLRLGSDNLSYEKLLPAILTYNKNNHLVPVSKNYSIQFLLSAIYDQGVENKRINNFFLSLLVTYPKNAADNSSDQSSRQVIRFLNNMRQKLRSRRRQLYDAHFILRLCLLYKLYQPAVLILLYDMDLYDQALKLALDNELTGLGEFVLREYDGKLDLGVDERAPFDIHDEEQLDDALDSSAVGKVKLEEENYATKKKLWLMFARYLIERVCSGKEVQLGEDDDTKTEEKLHEGRGEHNTENEKHENGRGESNGGSNENGEHKNGEKESKDNEDGMNEEKNVVEEKQGANGSSTQEATVLSITSDLASTILPPKVDEVKIDSAVVLKALNKTLKYILHLSSIGGVGVIGLKDLLPLFPNTILINDIKDEIVKSLNQYYTKISQLQLEMKESLNISNNLKDQIAASVTDSARAKVKATVEPGAPCRVCEQLLVAKNYILFPNCLHGFHKDCLIRFYYRLKGNYKFMKIFSSFKKDPSAVNKRELNDMLVQECPLCNEGSIVHVDSPLINNEWDSEDIDLWRL